ncbi:MAG: hypothetical protein Q7S55_02925 [Nanoarchaeota archaeon]|nr:hypothetical protein [Nanoarchaeota archaeon]
MNIAELVDKAINNIKKRKGYLDHGNDGIIYTITDEVVLKLHTGSRLGTPQKSAEHEFELGRELYQKGVQVPQYVSLFRALPSPRQESYGVFMQRIHGQEVSSLSPALHLEAQRQYQEQKKLVEKSGYLLGSDSKNMYINTLFNPKQRKLFLFDLVQWKRKPAL